ncbi:MAG: hypothetical protein H6538_02570 [Bacteroidales bacterium]|nr:hypothetical protein [Bacteroidales bacterium]MCB8999255.1 hypothetical protein [Bacteroidales bacterium]MCB9013077.1 hypothetical protein [Bacteroidales bacterium]
MNKPILLFFISIYACISLIAQDQPEGTIKYTPDFKFKDGLYISFEQLKANKPIPVTRISSETDHTDPDFFTNLLKEKKIIFFDDFGVQQSIPVEKIWGFSRNGIVYIRIGGNFSRITVIGSICHFVANITTYNSGYYDPYYYNPYYYRYPSNSAATTTTEMRQYIIDFQTGKIYDYDIQSLEVLLMKDPELYDEFAALGKKKKKQMKFLYIRKFNERNPLYIPVNN